MTDDIAEVRKQYYTAEEAKRNLEAEVAKLKSALGTIVSLYGQRREFSFPLPSNQMAELKVPGRMTAEDVDVLISTVAVFLEAARPALANARKRQPVEPTNAKPDSEAASATNIDQTMPYSPDVVLTAAHPSKAL